MFGLMGSARVSGQQNSATPAPTADALLTEAGDTLVTEDGDRIVTEE